MEIARFCELQEIQSLDGGFQKMHGQNVYGDHLFSWLSSTSNSSRLS